MRHSFVVSRGEALKDPTRHQFIAGMGYIAHSGAPELSPLHIGSKNCNPAAGAANGSKHKIKPPNGAAPLIMTWNTAVPCWCSLHPEQGNRLGWTPSHLSRAGWEYVGPV